MNCFQLRSRLEYATGGNARRWRGMVFGAAAACRGKHRLQPCEPKPRPAEARRIYKSPFLTGLAPLASARELLRHRSTASDKKPVPVSLPNQNRKLVAARATLRIAKPQKNSDQTTANEQRFSFNPPAPLRRQRIAESTNHTDKSRNPCHSGCEVAESEDNKNRTNTNRRTPPAQVLQASKNTLRPTEPIAGKKRCPED